MEDNNAKVLGSNLGRVAKRRWQQRQQQQQHHQGSCGNPDRQGLRFQKEMQKTGCGSTVFYCGLPHVQKRVTKKLPEVLPGLGEGEPPRVWSGPAAGSAS